MQFDRALLSATLLSATLLSATLLSATLLFALAAGCSSAPPATSDVDAGGMDAATISEVDSGARDAAIDAAADATVDAATVPDGGADAGCAGTICGGACVDEQSDIHHCGSCDEDCTALPFVDGTLTTCALGACVLACEPGHAHCSADVADGCEADLHSPATCGACATRCDAPLLCGTDASGVSSCVGGCADGEVSCGSACVDTTTDPMHCGGCDVTCGGAHATADCSGSDCTLTCDAGYADCNLVAEDGCEVATGTPLDCAFCGNVCTLPNVSAAGCSAGSCTVDTCAPGFGDCDGVADNGCEASVAADPMHCGTCGNACVLPNATPACVGGSCAVAGCNAGFGNCDGQASTGCEVNTTNDPMNCGGCGLGCALPNATAGCAGSMCVVATCDVGWSNCDGLASNGCETHTAVDPLSCGMCGHVCSVPSGSAGCAGGTCTVFSCSPGFADCNGLAADGCERNTRTDPMNCGLCGSVCFVPNGTPGCASSTCIVAGCNSGFGNCNGIYGDGCETNTTSSGTSCGTCGHNCSASCVGSVAGTSCASSSCVITGCNSTYFDLDLMCTDGCECARSPVATSCAAPQAIGTIVLGASTTSSANLVPAGTEAYYSVTFPASGDPMHHATIALTSNPGTEFRVETLLSCSGAVVITIPSTGGTFLAHVARVTGHPMTCSAYTLTFTN
jgi:hypothetical protein